VWFKIKIFYKQGMVVHTYNPSCNLSYSGDGGRRTESLRSAWAKKAGRCCLTKQMRWGHSWSAPVACARPWVQSPVLQKKFTVNKSSPVATIHSHFCSFCNQLPPCLILKKGWKHLIMSSLLQYIPLRCKDPFTNML
jgi:hypothetical protein